LRPNSESQPLQAWRAGARRADWKSPSDIKNVYRSAGFLANNRAVFNIKGNRYRVVVAVQYKYSIAFSPMHSNA